ncbi:MAG: hypothetical protein AMK70_11275 [Nitrospira bacterium SG8_35_1]|nr:MAG: hypothetical protein AMK70_11275 [Nitrospira bacterium SG8_35_1]
MNKEKMSVPDVEDMNEFIQFPKKEKISIHNKVTEDIYQKNYDALNNHHPELLDILEAESIDDDRIRIYQSESGDPRIVCKREDGEEIKIHSADDPVECANKAIDLLGNIEKEGIVVLFGFGLGYFAEAILERFEQGHILLIYEANPEIFKHALSVKDFSKLLDSDKVKIILGKDADNFSVIHSHHHLIINGKFWVVKHEPSIKLNAHAYDNFFRRLNEEKSLSDIGVSTNIRRGKEFTNAFLSNIHSIIRKPGVAGLKDIFKGCTAIVISAGPSLDKNIHLLKKIKGKAVLIATGGSLPSLLTCDIVPDLAVEVDPVADNIEDKFNENPELKNVPFICLEQYTPELVNIYPGPLFINTVPNNLASIWLRNYWEEKGSIECFGGSVAHLAFATAEYIGADVIAFVGQDLSYKHDRLHTVGYSDDLDRRLEKASEEKQENMLGGIPVKDIFGEEALSIMQFIVFKTSFENRIRGSEKIVVNATEGGLPIEGATNMRLVDFIDEYCIGQEEMDTFSVLSGLLNQKVDCRLDDLIDEVVMARKKYESIKRASNQILKHVKRVEKLKERRNEEAHELNNLLSKINKLIERVKHPLLNFLVGYNYGLELYLKKQEIQDIDEIDDKWEMLDKQLERGKLYYSEIVKTISHYNKQLEKVTKALKREKKIDSILNDSSVDDRDRFYRAGMIYHEAGIAAQAVKYLEAAISYEDGGNSDEESETYITLAGMYIKQFRYYDARAILEKFRDQGSKAPEKVEKLIQTCDKKIKAWQGRMERMEKLMKEAEADYGSHLESGYFYFRTGDFERAEKSYVKAISSLKSGVRSDELEASYYGLAHIYLAMNAPDKAIGALEKAIEVDPSNPVLYRDLGLIAFESNNIGPAETFLLKAIELAPKDAEFYKPLANLYMSHGETEKAAALYESAIEANADIPALQHDLALTYNSMIGNAETQ